MRSYVVVYAANCGCSRVVRITPYWAAPLRAGSDRQALQGCESAHSERVQEYQGGRAGAWTVCGLSTGSISTTGYPFHFNMTGHVPGGNIVEHRLSAEGLSPRRARAGTCHHYRVLDLHNALSLYVTMSTWSRKETAVLPSLSRREVG